MITYLSWDMSRLITWAVALSLLGGCSHNTSPESSRQELNRIGVAFNKETFIEAARSGEFRKVLLFLDGGINPDVTDDKGRTGLMKAAGFNEVATVQLLLDRRASVSLRDHDGMTALIYAVMAGSNNASRVLVDAGADINATDNRGATALIYAALDGHYECVRTLLERGAKPEEMTADGHTALLLLVKRTKQAAVRPQSERNALFKVRMDPIRTLRILVDHGANVNATNRRGQTALTLAEENGP
jgi:ankyrin repeat protein